MMLTDTKQPPFLRTPDSTSRMSRRFFAALLPVLAASVWVFRWSAVQTFSLSVIFCVLAELFWSRAFGKSFRIREWSSATTAVLFAFLLPPGVSWWAVLLGSFAAILLGKMIFGGLGQNLFNPPLVGFAVLTVLPGFDAVISREVLTGPDWGSVFLETGTGMTMGDVSKAAVLFGAALLVTRRLIPLWSPFFYLAAFGTLSWLFGRNPLADLLAGNTLLFAFFYVTDFVTAPVTFRGRMIFSAGAGALTVLLKIGQDTPAAGIYALLLMNAVAPLLDSFSPGTVSKRRSQPE